MESTAQYSKPVWGPRTVLAAELQEAGRCQPHVRNPGQQLRSATQSDPCISSVTTAIMITTSNSPVNWSGIHNQGNTKWNLSAKIEHRRPVAIAVLVTSSQSLASHANDYRERSATRVRQR